MEAKKKQKQKSISDSSVCSTNLPRKPAATSETVRPKIRNSHALAFLRDILLSSRLFSRDYDDDDGDDV